MNIILIGTFLIMAFISLMGGMRAEHRYLTIVAVIFSGLALMVFKLMQ